MDLEVGWEGDQGWGGGEGARLSPLANGPDKVLHAMTPSFLLPK